MIWCCWQLEDLSTVIQLFVDLEAAAAAAAAADDDDEFLLSTLCQLYLDTGNGKCTGAFDCDLIVAYSL